MSLRCRNFPAALVLKQYQTAITASNQLLNIDPNRADYHYLRARTYRMAGDTTASVAAYQTTLDRDPDFYRAHLELGYLLTSAGDENGVRYLQNALAIHDTSSAALLQNGQVSSGSRKNWELPLTTTSS